MSQLNFAKVGKAYKAEYRADGGTLIVEVSCSKPENITVSSKVSADAEPDVISSKLARSARFDLTPINGPETIVVMVTGDAVPTGYVTEY